MGRLMYFSCVSPKRILRAWKQVQVEFLRQGSSKLTSQIFYIFPLGSFREGVNNFVRAQNLPRKSILGLPDGPEYVFLRMKRDPLIFTYEAFSRAIFQTLSHAPRRSQTLSDAARPPRRSETRPNAPRRCQTSQNFHTLPDVSKCSQAFPDPSRRCQSLPENPRLSQMLPDAPRTFPDALTRCQTLLNAPSYSQTRSDAPRPSHVPIRSRRFQRLPDAPI